MKPSSILIRGAQQNTLKNINIDIPLKTFTVICGPSGSGKSSLAFETLFAEGQRRYTETLSNYIRQFIKEASKPNIESIHNVPPPIVLGQRNNIRSSRSIAGTHSEVLDHLRVIFAKTAQVQCPKHKIPLQGYSSSQGALKISKTFTKGWLLFPIEKTKKKHILQLKKQLLADGFTRIGFLKKTKKLEIQNLSVSTSLPSSFYVSVDRLMFSDVQRVSDSLSQCYKWSLQYNPHFKTGTAIVLDSKNKLHFLTENPSCPVCKYQFSLPVTPSLFNFNSTLGACSACKGFGNILSVDENKVVPNPQLSLAQGAISIFSTPSTAFERRKLHAFCKEKSIDLHIPWFQLKKKEQLLLWKGDNHFIGINGFFKFLEEKRYKMHIRILLARYKTPVPCKECSSRRLRKETSLFLFQNKTISEWTQMSFSQIEEYLNAIQLSSSQLLLIDEVLKTLKRKIQFINQIGLGYLRLNRPTRTLSGGELQRLNLASQLSIGLSQILYILDEPTIGLHSKDCEILISMLKNLQKNGNTILIIEHDPAVIKKAQHIIEMGPGSGEKGGQVIFSGSFSSFLKDKSSLTLKSLKRSKNNIVQPRPMNINNFKYFLKLKNCRIHNLKNINIQIPLNRMVVCSGVSGSGKSSLIVHTLYPALKQMLKDKKSKNSFTHSSIEGVERIKRAVLIDQSPAEQTLRSLIATYINIYTSIRNIMGEASSIQRKSFSPRDFSLNVDGGRCPECRGLGYQEIEMIFMDPIRLICESCKGLRFQTSILEVCFKRKNIHQILQMTVNQAMDFFKAHPSIFQPLSILKKVGLEYLKIGQSLSTLSGGESQRIKLARELADSNIKGTCYIFDEPSTGLHIQEIDLLLKVLDQLIHQGASVILIEHNLQMISNCDYIIDLGPKAGEEGGRIVGQSPLNDFILKNKGVTAQSLRSYLNE